MTNNTAESWETTARVEAENRRRLAEAVMRLEGVENPADANDAYAEMVELAKGMLK